MSKNRTEEALDTIIRNNKLIEIRNELKNNFASLKDSKTNNEFDSLKNVLFNKIFQLLINCEIKILPENKENSLIMRFENNSNFKNQTLELSKDFGSITQSLEAKLTPHYRLINPNKIKLGEYLKLNDILRNPERNLSHIKYKLENKIEFLKEDNLESINTVVLLILAQLESISKLLNQRVTFSKVNPTKNKLLIEPLIEPVQELRKLITKFECQLDDYKKSIEENFNNEFITILQELPVNSFNYTGNKIDSFLQSIINCAIKISFAKNKNELSNEELEEILNILETNTSINQLVEAEIKEALNVIKAGNLDESSAEKLAKVLAIFITNGDNASLEEMLRIEGFDVNIKIDGHSLLTLSMLNNFSKLEPFIEKLISDPKTDINFASPSGRTPLLYAVQNKNINIVKKLLEHKNFKFNDTDEFIKIITSIYEKFNDQSLVKDIIAKHIEHFDIKGHDISTKIQELIQEVKAERETVTEINLLSEIESPEVDSMIVSPLSGNIEPPIDDSV